MKIYMYMTNANSICMKTYSGLKKKKFKRRLLFIVTDNSHSISAGFEKPTFDSRCKIFELDPCDSFGKVCLVYRESKTGKLHYKIRYVVLSHMSSEGPGKLVCIVQNLYC